MTIAKTTATSFPCGKPSVYCTEEKQKKPFYILFVSIFLFPNLATPLHVGTRFVTASEVLILLVIFFILPSLKIRLKDLLIFIGVLFIGLISVLISIAFEESINSFLSLAFYSFFTFSMIQTARRKPYLIGLFLNAFLSAVFILSVYAVFQSVFISLFEPLDKIIYPFGPFTWHAQKQLLVNWRANSLYYEPNIFGMVSVFGFLLNLTIKKRGIVWNIVVLAGIGLSFATTTYLMLMISLITQLLLGRKSFGPLNKKKLALVLVLPSLIILGYSFSLEKQSFINNVPVLNRIREISVPGTSGYYRFTAQLSSVPFIFYNYPFGIGIGAIDLFLDNAPREISNYYMKGNNNYGKTVDNILLGWIISFGVFSFAFFLLFAMLLKKIITLVSVGLAVGMFIFCWGTGSFLFLEFWVLLLIQYFLTCPLDNSERSLLKYENMHA